MNRPNFFVIGAPKTGTTSLYYYLKEHHDVFVPEFKEQHFFSRSEMKSSYYDVYCANSLDEYLSNYKNVKDEKIIADISPTYLYHKKSADRIKKFNPKAKIMAILRDPIDRTISHYLMDLRIGYVNKPLSYYLNDNQSNYYKEYVGNSLYYEKIKYYKKLFGANCLVLSFSDIKSNPEKFMEEVFDFLKIDKIELDFSKKYNVYAQPPSSLMYYIRKLGIYNFLKKFIPKYIKDSTKPLLENKSAKKPEFMEERKILANIFKTEDRNIDDLLRRKSW